MAFSLCVDFKTLIKYAIGDEFVQSCISHQSLERIENNSKNFIHELKDFSNELPEEHLSI